MIFGCSSNDFYGMGFFCVTALGLKFERMGMNLFVGAGLGDKGLYLIGLIDFLLFDSSSCLALIFINRSL